MVAPSLSCRGFSFLHFPFTPFSALLDQQTCISLLFLWGDVFTLSGVRAVIVKYILFFLFGVLQRDQGGSEGGREGGRKGSLPSLRTRPLLPVSSHKYITLVSSPSLPPFLSPFHY